ncbi:protein O-GlcNAcase isoform X2 [Neocloeon triangulifer]|uniref:protein O-GlcNAcase isoform X2 n=1 Tax=Neocloeon triangulifer TaxID=2078957 RepID=UPI00286F906D|nr:protein O-GlcNAcase isoform X2 [Neocloeon triangulifer]
MSEVEAKNDGGANAEKSANSGFVCGVVEGFYGRPWTSEQRKDLFVKMKKWGMDSYLYAPKDDYKHRAYWRDLYSVEEAEHLTALVSAAKESGITFYYAISPGLDITYSSVKEVAALKRKLEQVSQFGCQAFALLFDDIEPEMSEADKEVFQSFAHAQVSVTNEIFQHLGQPKFMLCPTQYCAARAVPDVKASEYLNTIGSKLLPEIDVMWTGPKVISRLLTFESIEEITDVLKRPPIIWDNLHANDYDQKRVFLGPYAGRSPDLMRKLRGVLTNPNCEYGANFVAIHTLAQWSRCSMDGKVDLSLNDPVSADIKLEIETEDGVAEEVPTSLSPLMYHPRRALRNAIVEWLTEFKKPKPAWGPIEPKPQIMPTVSICTTIAPSAPPVAFPPTVNTCLSVTTTTTSTTTGCIAVPISNHTSQLDTLADVCSFPQTGAFLNSLVADEKVVSSDESASQNAEPMEINATPDSSLPASISSSELKKSSNEDVAMADSVSCESCSASVTPTGSSNMQMSSVLGGSSSMLVEETLTGQDRDLTEEDLILLCELFYLPFEHGAQGAQFLQEFTWLKLNAVAVIHAKNKSDGELNTPEIQEWFKRSERFNEMTESVNQLYQRLSYCNNRELLHDLYPYIWDIRGVVSLLNCYIKWLGSCKTIKDVLNAVEQEPWLFRGGLIADLQRQIPVDTSNDLFLYKPPDVPCNKIYNIRPYLPADEAAVYSVCIKTCMDGMDGTDQFEKYPELIGDKMVGHFLNFSPEFCFVVEDGWDIVGYVLAAVDARDFLRKTEMAWIPNLCEKYPKPNSCETAAEKVIDDIYHFKDDVPDTIVAHNPSLLTSAMLTSVLDQSIPKRLMICLFASLRAHGSTGCHVEIKTTEKYLHEFYAKLGFVELEQGQYPYTIYMGRTF